MRATVRARIELIAARVGGRAAPLVSGYRSLVRVEGDALDIGFQLDLDPGFARDGIAPGGTGTGRLWFWAQGLPPLRPGQRLVIREGTRVVGHAIVLDEPGAG